MDVPFLPGAYQKVVGVFKEKLGFPDSEFSGNTLKFIGIC